MILKGKDIIALRKKMGGISQEALAREISSSRESIRAWEADERKPGPMAVRLLKSLANSVGGE